MRVGIEYQFCSSWDGWDEVDTFALQFSNAVLLPHVASVVGIEVAEVMTVDCSTGIISFYLADGSSKDFNFTAVLGDQV